MNERKARVAAFFDLDGTLVRGHRWSRVLQRSVPAGDSHKELFLWLKEAVRLAPAGSGDLQANKCICEAWRFLTSVTRGTARSLLGTKTATRPRTGVGSAFRKGAAPSTIALSHLFAQAIETVGRHVKQGHEIVLISGRSSRSTGSGARLGNGACARGITVTIRVIATRLEERTAGGRGAFRRGHVGEAKRARRSGWLQAGLG